MKKLSLIYIALLCGTILYIILVIKPRISNSAPFTNASATLTNPRFSYKAGVTGGVSGTTTVTIDSSGNPDNDTDHLFPSDTVCFVNAAETGCIGNTTYSVDSVTSSNSFTTTTALNDNLSSSDYVMATQSGSLTLSFTTKTEIPSTGSVLVTIPAVNSSGKTNDGIADTASATSANGFDISTVAPSDISITGCTPANWTVTSITAGTATTDHQILINRSGTSCPADTVITINIDSTPGIINPAPITTHVQGQSDSYRLNIKSLDTSGTILDTTDVVIAPVEGVLITATVEEALSFTVSGISADSGTYCGVSRNAASPDTTATKVPWGTLNPTYTSGSNNTQQQITISTNSSAGYSVYVEENDQMGKDGASCNGPNAAESINCIKDTVCDGTGCTHQIYRDWGADPSSYEGLGYSLQNQTGSDATFEFNSAGSTFNAKQFADQEAGESKMDTNAHIMTRPGSTTGSSIYICYRLDITNTQPAGYYSNRVKYTAISNF